MPVVIAKSNNRSHHYVNSSQRMSGITLTGVKLYRLFHATELQSKNIRE